MSGCSGRPSRPQAPPARSDRVSVRSYHPSLEGPWQACSKVVHVVDAVRTQQLLPIGPDLLLAIVRPNQGVIPEPRQIHEHVLEVPVPRVLPDLVRIRGPVIPPVQPFVRRAIQDEDPAPVGTPARGTRRATLFEPAV